MTRKTETSSTVCLVSYSTCLDKCLLFVGTLCAIVHGAAMPTLAVVFGEMTTKFLSAQNLSSVSLSEDGKISDRDFLSTFSTTVREFCKYYVYLGLIAFVMSYGQITCWEAACERRVHNLRTAYFKCILNQEISWYDTQSSGQLTTRLNDDLDRVRQGTGDKVSLFIKSVSAFIFGYIVAFTYCWKLTLVMISLAPLMIITAALMAVYTRSLTQTEQEKYAIAGGIAKETVSSIRTVLAFNGQRRAIERFDEALESGRRQGLTKNIWLTVGTCLSIFIMFSSYALAFWYGAVLIVNDASLPRGTIFTVFLAVVSGSSSLGNAFPYLQAVASAKGASKVIVDCIRNLPKINGSARTGLKPGIVKGNIEFINVHFAYPVRKDNGVLKGISFTIKPGQKVAFVGASGSSKSTIINLLLRYYDPDKGKISIDGTDVKKFNVKFLRNLIGVVAQEPVLFDGSVEENIRLGNPSASNSEISEAIKLANAYDFLCSLPEGLDTRVGEKGMQLSCGQKQRIAIARALIGNPKILLLDEATSALDTENESLVQLALEKAQEGRTTLVIAHRMSTIQDSEKIFVLSHGDIVEEGTYHELMEHKEFFYKMVMAQQLDVTASFDATTEEILTPEILDSMSSVVSDIKPTTCGDMDFLKERREESPKTLMKGKEPVSFVKLLRANYESCGWIVGGLFGSFIIGIVVPIFALLYSQIFQVYSEERNELKADAAKWSWAFVCVGLLQGFGAFIGISMLTRAGENITKQMRVKTFSNVLCQDATYFDDEAHNTGSICTRFATDAPNVRYVFTRLPWILSSIITITGGIVVAFIFGWKLTIIIVALVPLIIGAGYVQFKMQYGHQVKEATQLEQAGMISAEAIENIRTVQALACEDLFLSRYERSLEIPFRQNMYLAHVYGLAFGFSQSIIYFMYAVAFYFGSQFVGIGEMIPLNVYRVFFEITFCSTSFGKLSSFIPDVVKGRLSATLLFNMIEEKPGIDSCSEGGVKHNLKGQVQLKDVHFSYPSRPTVPVLTGINITVEPGQKVALVGLSGCGKSTIVSLLQRFYDASAGEVLFDGYNVKTLNLQHHRQQIGLVSQEPVLFDCSIHENIGYGLEGDIDHIDIVRAAKIANIHQFILTLPLGYNTNVGEKGLQLSGGQKQRIAIARALVRNPKVLLLDEATSALDTENEQLVQEALDDAGEGRTCIVIAHRLSTIQNADNIIVIGNGKVVEQGTHQQLLEHRGLYSTLCQQQSLMENGKS